MRLSKLDNVYLLKIRPEEDPRISSRVYTPVGELHYIRIEGFGWFQVGYNDASACDSLIPLRPVLTNVLESIYKEANGFLEQLELFDK